MSDGINPAEVAALAKTQRLMGDVMREMTNGGRASDDECRAAASEMLRCSVEAAVWAYGPRATAAILYQMADKHAADGGE